jgi:small subunit ribosomal protein S16
MLTLRLRPNARKHPNKTYSIVVAEKARSVSKKFHEKLGHYNPITKEFAINNDRTQYYLDLNTEVSKTLLSLLKKQGIIKK